MVSLAHVLLSMFPSSVNKNEWQKRTLFTLSCCKRLFRKRRASYWTMEMAGKGQGLEWRRLAQQLVALENRSIRCPLRRLPTASQLQGPRLLLPPNMGGLAVQQKTWNRRQPQLLNHTLIRTLHQVPRPQLPMVMLFDPLQQARSIYRLGRNRLQ